jgi:4-amino-4-deoxy-L-arabinose transferase-like glycosyltransferase
MMKNIRSFVRDNLRLLVWLAVGTIGMGLLLFYKLGDLVGGLSANESAAVAAPLGWHDLYRDPLYLPLKLLRAVVFTLFPDHGQILSRLPNAIFGGLSVLAFAWLVRLWHGTRPALLAGLMFATGAWVLHVSRLASFDVLYLWALPTLLLAYLQLQKRPGNWLVWYGSLLLTGLMLYIPGMIWLILVNFYLQRRSLAAAWQEHPAAWQRSLYLISGLIWLPPLIINLARSGQLLTWLGLPDHLAGPLALIKQLIGVPVHLFVRGPQYPEVWLGRAPILSIFTLVVCVVGIYFYATHRQSIRSRLLAAFFAVGWLLVGLGGPVGLSLLVPLLYIAAATGIAYLLHDWLKTFPVNPLARSLGLGLISLAVALSCLYNLRAYFVAWPHNKSAQATFQYHR